MRRWVRSIRKRAGLGHVHPHMLRAAFIMAALDAGVPLRDVQLAARHADPRTTTIYDRRRQNLDRHAAYVVVAFVTSGQPKGAAWPADVTVDLGLGRGRCVLGAGRGWWPQVAARPSRPAGGLLLVLASYAPDFTSG